MRWLKQVVIGLMVVSAVVTFPFSVYRASENSKKDDKRVKEQIVREKKAAALAGYNLCLRDQKTYDVLHALIAQAGTPQAGSPLTRLQLPPETPPWFREVLRQLVVSPDASTLDRFFAVLGDRPVCTKP